MIQEASVDYSLKSIRESVAFFRFVQGSDLEWIGVEMVRSAIMTFCDPILASPGFFKLRKVKGGAWLPARLWKVERRDENGDLVADVKFFASINGQTVDPWSPPFWPWTEISKDEFDYLTQDAAWARTYAPNKPIARPDVPAQDLPKEFF